MVIAVSWLSGADKRLASSLEEVGGIYAELCFR